MQNPFRPHSLAFLPFRKSRILGRKNMFTFYNVQNPCAINSNPILRIREYGRVISAGPFEIDRKYKSKPWIKELSAEPVQAVIRYCSGCLVTHLSKLKRGKAYSSCSVENKTKGK